jgi:RNA polymerase sigma-70 factor (ECF subfamily)
MTVFRGQPELLQRFRAGEPGALEAVYRTYVDRVAGILRFGFRVASTSAIVSGLTGNAHDTADLVQEVFMKAFAPAARLAYDGLRDYAPFLYAIARNVAVDWARRGGREVLVGWAGLERAEELAPSDDEPPWADEVTMSIVNRYVERLDDELRPVHEARYRDGLSQRDAAEKLGIGRQRLRTLEARLRDGLRRALTEARVRH